MAVGRQIYPAVECAVSPKTHVTMVIDSASVIYHYQPRRPGAMLPLAYRLPAGRQGRQVAEACRQQSSLQAPHVSAWVFFLSALCRRHFPALRFDRELTAERRGLVGDALCPAAGAAIQGVSDFSMVLKVFLKNLRCFSALVRLMV